LNHQAQLKRNPSLGFFVAIDMGGKFTDEFVIFAKFAQEVESAYSSCSFSQKKSEMFFRLNFAKFTGHCRPEL
jgi:hypothetical protein